GDDIVIVQDDDVRARRREGLPASGRRLIHGDALPTEAHFLERALRFSAEITGGQKTGFYLDQRDNRLLAETLAHDRTVLDLFSHSGAFVCAVLRGGATRVVAVESSARLLPWAKRHVTDNELDLDRVEFLRANVFDWLRRHDQTYGLVVCDPPPLATSRGHRQAAARAYQDLNRNAFARVADGGFLLTFTCSAAVDAKLFRQILFAAAREAGVEAQLLRPLAAATDHPLAITHPEGEYLKGWWIAVRR
ncbi:MAG: class I SAM-dependent methyltransferase, partial [Acidobacteriota bacterium]